MQACLCDETKKSVVNNYNKSNQQRPNNYQNDKDSKVPYNKGVQRNNDRNNDQPNNYRERNDEYRSPPSTRGRGDRGQRASRGRGYARGQGGNRGRYGGNAPYERRQRMVHNNDMYTEEEAANAERIEWEYYANMQEEENDSDNDYDYEEKIDMNINRRHGNMRIIRNKVSCDQVYTSGMRKVSSNNDTWMLLDSGADEHCINDVRSLRENIIEKRDRQFPAVALTGASGEPIPTIAIGDINSDINNVYVSTELDTNIMSTNRLCEKGYWVIMPPTSVSNTHRAYVCDQSGKIILVSDKIDG